MDSEPQVRKLELSQVEKLSSVVRSCIAGPDSVRPPGEYFVALEPNAFGLPSVETCPGKTDYCELDCYAIQAEKRTATHRKLQRNLEALQADPTVEAMTVRIRGLVNEYAAEAKKLHVTDNDRHFRIHWSGDFFSADYAAAWRTVIEENQGIRFFTYTRSFTAENNILPVLAGTENLDLFLSVDEDNVDDARIALAETPGVSVAYLVDYKVDAEILALQLGRTEGFRTKACPENLKDAKTGRRKLPVISKLGGACARCSYCVGNPENWDVVFVKRNLESPAQETLPIPGYTRLEMPRARRTPKNAQPLGSVAIAEAHPALFGVEY